MSERVRELVLLEVVKRREGDGQGEVFELSEEGKGGGLELSKVFQRF